MIEPPTENEIALTIAGTMCILTIRQLLNDYENLAAKHEIVTSPAMQSGVERTIENMLAVFAENPALEALSSSVMDQMRDYIHNKKIQQN